MLQLGRLTGLVECDCARLLGRQQLLENFIACHDLRSFVELRAVAAFGQEGYHFAIDLCDGVTDLRCYGAIKSLQLGLEIDLSMLIKHDKLTWRSDWSIL